MLFPSTIYLADLTLLLALMIVSPVNSFQLQQSKMLRHVMQESSKTTKVPSRLYLDGQGMAGGTFNKHLLGDVLRSLQPQYLSQVKESITGNISGPKQLDLEPLQQFVEQDKSKKSPPSWTDLERRLIAQQKPSEKLFRTKLEEGTLHSAHSSHRTFSHTNNISITLYRDSASWCPYCQKVWIALEEKQIPYEIVPIAMNCYAGGSKPTEFLQVQPSGTLPCIVVHNDATAQEDVIILRQSDEILQFLDEINNDEKSKRKHKIPQLLPPKGNAAEERRMEYLCDDGRSSLERRLYSEWMWYLTGKRKPVEYRERYEAVLDEVESALNEVKGQGPYFMGKDLSMADIKFIPFLERQAGSLLYYKGFQVRDSARWPNLVKWFEAMESRPSYLETKSDVYTHSRALPPQLAAGCTFATEEECGLMRDAIDAFCQPSSLSSQLGGMEWYEEGWVGKIEGARREAVERIIHNKENIIKFASRAAGTPGFPAASAPLADPRASLNNDAYFAVDIFLRYVIDLLLVSDQTAQKRTNTDVVSQSLGSVVLAAKELSKGGGATVAAVVDCLDYLRVRIGVPRDMSYPAGRELRGELLRVSNILLSHGSNTSRSNDLRTEQVNSGQTQLN